MGALTVEGWKRCFVAELQSGGRQFRRITLQLANQIVWRRVREFNGVFLHMHKECRTPRAASTSPPMRFPQARPAVSEFGIGESPLGHTLSVFAKIRDGSLWPEAT